MTIYKQTADGDLAFPLKIITDPDLEVAQRLTNNFRSFRGDWYQDTRRGMPWYQQVLGQKSIELVKSLLRRAALLTEGVREVLEVRAAFDPGTRNVNSFIRVRSVTGRIITGSAGAAFILE